VYIFYLGETFFAITRRFRLRRYVVMVKLYLEEYRWFFNGASQVSNLVHVLLNYFVPVRVKINRMTFTLTSTISQLFLFMVSVLVKKTFFKLRANIDAITGKIHSRTTSDLF